MFINFSVTGVFSTESPSSEPFTSVVDGPEASCAESERPALPRSTSERLLTANRDFVCQEKDLREKYHEIIYNVAEKVMRTSQANQYKFLKVSSCATTALFTKFQIFEAAINEERNLCLTKCIYRTIGSFGAFRCSWREKLRTLCGGYRPTGRRKLRL